MSYQRLLLGSKQFRQTTSSGNRMVLHRFSDAVKQTPNTLGMQVHRSHWVALSAVKNIIIEGQSMKLKLVNDKEVPVR